MMKTLLTPEESAKLIELGVDAKLASKKKFVPLPPEVLKGNAEYAKPWGFFPIFDLSDVIGILPKEIEHKFDDGSSFTAQLFMEIFEGKWNVGYQESRKGATQANLFEEKPRLSLYWVWLPELIDALCQLLIYVLTNFPNEIHND